MGLCRLSSPIIKRIPKRVLPLFARVWAGLLSEAVHSKEVQAWWQFLAFPRLVLLPQARGGKKVGKGKSLTDLIQQRIEVWPTQGERQDMLKKAQARSGHGRQKEAGRVAQWAQAKRKNAAEKAIVRAIRAGDVSLALRRLLAAPLADKTADTLAALKNLHPTGPQPEAIPPSPTPFFTAETVGPALCSFGPGSAGGLFGYTAFHLQQCWDAESWSFSGALLAAVNQLASGEAPPFLKPFLAGGVSIALRKGVSGVRPLCCGDPLRRLVAKCFCLGGKEEIAEFFDRKNYGVGCKGGVEVVAHSLRDTLQKHAKSDLGLLKIDFSNAFNRVSRNAFMRATCEEFPGLTNWTNWCYGEQSPSCRSASR